MDWPPRASMRAPRLTLVASLRGMTSTSSMVFDLVGGQPLFAQAMTSSAAGTLAGRLDDGVDPPAPLGVAQSITATSAMAGWSMSTRPPRKTLAPPVMIMSTRRSTR